MSKYTPGECNKKSYGAIACPLGMNNSPPAQIQSSYQPTVTFPSLSSQSVPPPVTSQLDFGFLNHKPSFKCDCQSCGSYFEDLSAELNFFNIDFNIERLWTDLHFPAWENEDARQSSCRWCGSGPVCQKSGLCHECDVEDFERAWNEKYGDYLDSDDEYFSH